MAGDYEVFCKRCPLLITECVTASEGLVPELQVGGETEGGGLIFCFTVLFYSREQVSY